MKLPSRLTIGKSEYSLAFSDVLHERVAGACHQDAKLILLSTNQDADEAMATLWHEILHAIEAEYKVKLGHSRIKKLEYALAQVFEQLPCKHSK